MSQRSIPKVSQNQAQQSQKGESDRKFPSPHGFIHAEDTIGYEKNITFLDREIVPSFTPERARRVDIPMRQVHVRFAPESGHSAERIAP